ncbi:MAG TPA: hypothetical protein VFV32_12150 [Acidimicrobiales bacterium]|nr:hypothetical protein [Acidimicrobiales bacterium]
MQQSPAIRFARTVQSLSAAARALGLEVPGFRSPPRLVGVQRSIKRGAGGITVAVVVKDRPWAAVQADLVEGVIAANGLEPPVADRVRSELWAAIEPVERPTGARVEASPGAGVRPAA